MEPSPPSPQPDVACAVKHTDTEGRTIPCPGHTEPDPIAEARRLLQQDQQQRMQSCAAEIQQVLDRYGMTLEVTPAQITLAPRIAP